MPPPQHPASGRWRARPRRQVPEWLASPAGKMTMGVINAVAEFERDLLIERTQAGLSPTLERQVTPTSAAFVAAKLPAAPRSDLLIEIERGGVHVKVIWPVDAGPASAAWLSIHELRLR